MYERSAEDDVVDGDKEKLDDVSDASHDGESQGAWLGDFLELYSQSTNTCDIWLFAYLQKSVWLLAELFHCIHCTLDLLVHSVLSIEIFIYLDYVEFNFLNFKFLLFLKYITSFML